MEDAAGAVSPTDAWLDRLADLIGEAPVNLVSRGDRGHVRARHLEECVRVAQQLDMEAGTRWMDLGTGGGLPGLVLAHAFPAVSWTLLDARGKKIGQVARFARVLGLTNVTATHARAEELGATDDARGGYDGVVSRAVSSLLGTIALARPFVTTGQIIAIRGPGAPADARRLVSAAADLGVVVEDVEPVDGTIRPTWLVRVRGRGPVPQEFSKTWRALHRQTRGGSSDGTA